MNSNNDQIEKSFSSMIRADMFRYVGAGTKSLLYSYFHFIGFRYVFWMRLSFFLKKKKIKISYYISRYFLYRMKIKLGIDIPYNTDIKPGFYIGHFGGIVVHPDVKIGWNCNISNRVTLGVSSRGKNKGVPQIGDNVYIGPGAVIIGSITIGDNVAIGANCVVTKDIPENAVVVGVPCRIISYKGSEGYVRNRC